MYDDIRALPPTRMYDDICALPPFGGSLEDGGAGRVVRLAVRLPVPRETISCWAVRRASGSLDVCADRKGWPAASIRFLLHFYPVPRERSRAGLYRVRLSGCWRDQPQAHRKKVDLVAHILHFFFIISLNCRLNIVQLSYFTRIWLIRWFHSWELDKNAPNTKK